MSGTKKMVAIFFEVHNPLPNSGSRDCGSDPLANAAPSQGGRFQRTTTAPKILTEMGADGPSRALGPPVGCSAPGILLRYSQR